MTKVVFIYPGISGGVGFENHNSAGATTETWPHPGMALMSGVLKEAGFEVQLIDLRRLTGWDEFDEKVRGFIDCDEQVLFGITVLTVNYGIVKQTVERLRSVAPDYPIVAGGPHVTLLTEEIEKENIFDYIVKAEGELMMLDLVKQIDSGTAPDHGTIKGVPCENLDDLPFLDRELFAFEEQPVNNLLPKPFMTLVAGRGCLYHCTFCQPAERLMFGSVRNRTPANVIEEIKYLIETHGLKSTMFQDDCLTQERDWIFEFCDLLDENNIDLKWACQARADIICDNEDMIERMSKSGCIVLSIGFESGNDRVLKFLGKHTTRAQNLGAAEICHKYDIKIICNYMLGMPGETEEEVWDTVSMVKQIKPYVYLCSFFTPTPGTGLYTYCERNDLLIDRPWEEYSRYPDGEKIKGVDYDLMKRAMIESQKVGETLEPVAIRSQLETQGEHPTKILLIRAVRTEPFQQAIDDFNAILGEAQVDILVNKETLPEFPDSCTNGDVYHIHDKFFYADSVSDELYQTLQANDYDAIFIVCKKVYHHGYAQPQMVADRILEPGDGKRFYITENREITSEFLHATLQVACE